MFRSICSSNRISWAGRWGCLAVCVACLGLSGCRSLDSYDFSHTEGIPEATEAAGASAISPPRVRSLPHALTNEGMEIERDFGIR